MTTTALPRGHLLRAHTADEIVEAWGPTREACLEEAVCGLVDSLAEIEHVARWWRHEVVLEGSDDELLVGLLEEVITLLDADGAVPVVVTVRPHDDGVRAHLWLTGLADVVAVGAAPKGVSRSGLTCLEQAPGRWRATATIDV